MSEYIDALIALGYEVRLRHSSGKYTCVAIKDGDQFGAGANLDKISASSLRGALEELLRRIQFHEKHNR